MFYCGLDSKFSHSHRSRPHLSTVSDLPSHIYTTPFDSTHESASLSQSKESPTCPNMHLKNQACLNKQKFSCLICFAQVNSKPLTQLELDLQYNRYIQWLFVNSKAKKTFQEQEKSFMVIPCYQNFVYINCPILS